MKAENISDALAFLDDDIIEETEIFRNRKKNYKTIWLRCLSAAACLCIALVAVFGALQYVPNSDFPLRGQGAGDNYLKGGDVEEYKYGGTFGTADSSVTFPKDGVYLEITEWKRNYFYALVLGSENDDLTIGMKVKVKLKIFLCCCSVERKYEVIVCTCDIDSHSTSLFINCNVLEP